VGGDRIRGSRSLGGGLGIDGLRGSGDGVYVRWDIGILLRDLLRIGSRLLDLLRRSSDWAYTSRTGSSLFGPLLGLLLFCDCRTRNLLGLSWERMRGFLFFRGRRANSTDTL
jgi:hypothetical protein